MGKRKNLESTPCETAAKKVTRNNMSAVTCKVCLEPIDLFFVDEDTFNVLCRECKDRFHGDCVGIGSKFFYNLIQKSKRGWACYNCVENKMQFMDNITDRVTTIERNVEKNAAVVSNLQASVDAAFGAMNERIDEVRQSLSLELVSLKSTSAPSLATQNSSQTCSEEISYVRALQRQNNLIIQNIPGLVGENPQLLKEKIVKIATCYGHILNINDIVIVVRLRGKPIVEGQSNVREILDRPFSNSLLVKFTDVSVKDEFFRKYIIAVSQKKFVTGASVGFPAGERIFINHHLSPDLSMIKMKASEMKKAGMISKISARYDCVKVFANNTWHKITNIEMLNMITPMASPQSQHSM